MKHAHTFGTAREYRRAQAFTTREKCMDCDLVRVTRDFSKMGGDTRVLFQSDRKGMRGIDLPIQILVEQYGLKEEHLG